MTGRGSSTSDAEALRLREIERLGVTRDEADEVLQELVDELREMFGTELCMVNLVLSEVQHFKAWSGRLPAELAAAQQGPRQQSMCQHVVEDRAPLVVHDFLASEAFKDQHFRLKYGIHFYAGVPLATAGGQVIGSLCLLNSEPMEFGDKDLKVLSAFAKAVVERLETLAALEREKVARRSEQEQYRNLFELANDAIIVYDLEKGVVLDANGRASEMYGLPKESLAGKSVRDLSLDVQKEQHRQMPPSGGAFRSFETVHHRTDGSTLRLWVNASVIEYEGRRAVLAISRDVTGLRRAEWQLRLLERALTESNNGVIIARTDEGRDNRIVYVNPAFEHITGYRAEEVVGRDTGFLQGPDRDQSTLEDLLSSIGEGRECRATLCNHRKDGTPFWNELNISPMRDREGRLTHFIVVHSDVTGRKRMEESLRESEEWFRSLVQNASDVVVVIDRNGGERYQSPSLKRVLGHNPEDRVGKSIFDVIHPDDMVRSRSVLARLADSPQGSISPTLELRARHEDGSWHHLEGVATNLLENPGVAGIVVNARDVTERRQAEEKLRNSEAELRALFAAMSDVILVLDEEGRYLMISSNDPSLLYGPPEKRIGKTVHEVLPDEQADMFLRCVRRALGGRRTVHTEYSLLVDGRELWFSAAVSPMQEDKVVWVARDITGRKLMEEALKESEERFRTLTDAALEAIVIIGEDEILEVNQAYTAMFGYEPKEIIGKLAPVTVAPESRELVRSNIASGFEGTYEVTGLRKNGTRFDMEVRGRASTYRGRDVRVTAIRDITERKTLERRLRHQATHDSLTGLPNRTLFAERLAQALRRTERQEGGVAMLFVDLDNFKFVNDSLGHEVGDRLLVAVAERLRACVRPEDTVGRLAGDEFTILISDVRDADEASRATERVAEALRSPFVLAGEELYVTASIGVALGASPGDRPEKLLRNADLAMYQAKINGKAHHAVFDPNTHGHAS